MFDNRLGLVRQSNPRYLQEIGLRFRREVLLVVFSSISFGFASDRSPTVISNKIL